MGPHRNGMLPEVKILCAVAVWMAVGCSASARRLDPVYAGETSRAALKFHFERGVTDPGILRKIEPGDLVAFSSTDPKSGSLTVLMAALSQVGHVAIVFSMGKKLRALSADSERGVYVDTLESCIQNRSFYVFSFPPGLLDLSRLNQFASRAVFMGRLDYDWSAVFGLNSNLTPNILLEAGDEYTCSTVVAAALHFSGLSLDRAWWGIITPGDIIYSIARRNLNGPAIQSAPKARRVPNRESEVWEALR